MKILSLSGKAGHGKDTVAKAMRKCLEKDGQRVLILHFADVLKYSAKEYFGWNGSKEGENRTLLQTLGTNIARKNNEGVWARIVGELIKAFKSEFDYFIVPDCRFKDEIFILTETGKTHTILIVRDGYKSKLTPEQQLHESETALDEYRFQTVLHVGEGEDEVQMVAERFLKNFN